MASQTGNLSLVKYLIEQLHVNWKETNNEGYDSLWIALYLKQQEIACYLFQLDKHYNRNCSDKVSKS